GTLAEPDLSGSGVLRVGAGDAPALISLYEQLAMPAEWRDFLALSAPAELLVNIGEPVDAGQTVTLSGVLGAADFNLRAELGGGIAELASAPLRVTGALESSDIAGLTRQLGFGDTPLFDGAGSMLVSLSPEGAPSNSLGSSITASLGEERISYAGTLLLANDNEIQGTGMFDVALADAGGLAGILGATGLALPAIEAG